MSSFAGQCFEARTFKAIEQIHIGGAVLLRKVMAMKFQVPDSFPYIIERDFSEQTALEYEGYVAKYQQQNNLRVEVDSLSKF